MAAMEILSKIYSKCVWVSEPLLLSHVIIFFWYSKHQQKLSDPFLHAHAISEVMIHGRNPSTALAGNRHPVDTLIALAAVPLPPVITLATDTAVPRLRIALPVVVPTERVEGIDVRLALSERHPVQLLPQLQPARAVPLRRREPVPPRPPRPVQLLSASVDVLESRRVVRSPPCQVGQERSGYHSAAAAGATVTAEAAAAAVRDCGPSLMPEHPGDEAPVQDDGCRAKERWQVEVVEGFVARRPAAAAAEVSLAPAAPFAAGAAGAGPLLRVGGAAPTARAGGWGCVYVLVCLGRWGVSPSYPPSQPPKRV